MKTRYLLCLGWLLLASSGVAAEASPIVEVTELRTIPDEIDYGKRDGHGKLVFQELYEDDVPAGWHNTLAYYPHGSRQAVKLQRNVSAMNVFLAAEIRRPSTVRTFLKESLWEFLLLNLGDAGGPVTTRYITPTGVDTGLGSDPSAVFHASASAAKRARLKAEIRRYAGSAEPVVAGNGWTVDVNVLTDKGAVEHWLVKGRVTPLQIDSFLCEPKEPPGTFYPARLIH